MTDLEKMKCGKLYNPNDPTIIKLRSYIHRRMLDYNTEKELYKRTEILKEVLGQLENGVCLEPPVHIDYGHISFGKNSCSNFNFTALDCAPISIGENVFIGPNVTMITAMHPLLPEERMMQPHDDNNVYGIEYALPITVEDHVWIASNVIILPNVTVGTGSVIGAGSVVTHSVPPHVLAAGNPCKVIQQLTAEDSVHLKF